VVGQEADPEIEELLLGERAAKLASVIAGAKAGSRHLGHGRSQAAGLQKSTLGGAVEVLALTAQEPRQAERATNLVDVALVVDLKERVVLLGVGERSELDLSVALRSWRRDSNRHHSSRRRTRFVFHVFVHGVRAGQPCRAAPWRVCG
jgi:hypothetical protein